MEPRKGAAAARQRLTANDPRIGALIAMLAMKEYRNGDSGVIAYRLEPRAIVVQFKTGGTYKYSHASAGKAAVEQMQLLAQAGRGLATYINQNKPAYETRAAV